MQGLFGAAFSKMWTPSELHADAVSHPWSHAELKQLRQAAFARERGGEEALQRLLAPDAVEVERVKVTELRPPVALRDGVKSTSALYLPNME